MWGGASEREEAENQRDIQRGRAETDKRGTAQARATERETDEKARVAAWKRPTHVPEPLGPAKWQFQQPVFSCFVFVWETGSCRTARVDLRPKSLLPLPLRCRDGRCELPHMVRVSRLSSPWSTKSSHPLPLVASQKKRCPQED